MVFFMQLHFATSTEMNPKWKHFMEMLPHDDCIWITKYIKIQASEALKSTLDHFFVFG